MSKKQFRTLSESEQTQLAPFLAEYAEAQGAFERAADRLQRVLRLAEPRMAEDGVTFDPQTGAFFEPRDGAGGAGEVITARTASNGG